MAGECLVGAGRKGKYSLGNHLIMIIFAQLLTNELFLYELRKCTQNP